jgi:hypothetical protein
MSQPERHRSGRLADLSRSPPPTVLPAVPPSVTPVVGSKRPRARSTAAKPRAKAARRSLGDSVGARRAGGPHDDRDAPYAETLARAQPAFDDARRKLVKQLALTLDVPPGRLESLVPKIEAETAGDDTVRRA